MISKLATEMMKKEAASRWKVLWKALNSGSKGRLINDDVVKPWREEAAGINRGTRNLVERYGGTLEELSGNPWETFLNNGQVTPMQKLIDARGYMTTGKYSPMRSDTIYYLRPGAKGSIRDADGHIPNKIMLDALAKRHEAYELMEDAMKSRANPNVPPSLSQMHRLPETRLERWLAYLTETGGTHSNPRVLSRELELLQRSPNLSIRTKALQEGRLATGDVKALLQAAGVDTRGLQDNYLLQLLYSRKHGKRFFDDMADNWQRKKVLRFGWPTVFTPRRELIDLFPKKR